MKKSFIVVVQDEGNYAFAHMDLVGKLKSIFGESALDHLECKDTLDYPEREIVGGVIRVLVDEDDTNKITELLFTECIPDWVLCGLEFSVDVSNVFE